MNAVVAANDDYIVDVRFPKPAHILFRQARYKVLFGGRGSGKSWSIAKYLLMEGKDRKHRILCCREFQASIAESVHHLLVDQIYELGLQYFYKVTKTGIVGLNGTEFLFSGLRYNISSIKSMEGLTMCWIEEAQSVTKTSWDTLIPTLFRRPGFQVIISFNPVEEDDPVFKTFVKNTPPEGSLVAQLNWDENKWFPEDLDIERKYMLANDPELYDHVYGGEVLTIGEAVIFRKRVEIVDFEEPPWDALTIRPFYGLDFGFANDPLACIRCWIDNDCLWIRNEYFGYGIELDDIPAKLDATIPGIRDWPIKADASRPETISFLKNLGFNISAAEKWQGSVEDGIAHLKAFKKIYIHPDCENIATEARMYKYKVDPKTNDVLPIIVDKHNHGWDATRYALDGYIAKGTFSMSTFLKAFAE